MRSVPPIRLVLVRWQLWALIAVGAGLIIVTHQAYATVYIEPDLQVWWMAARLWLTGIDPYGPVGDQLLGTGSGFAYPFPAVLFCLPLAVLPLAWASTVWALMSLAIAGVLPFALQERPDPRIVAVMLAYFPLWASLEEGQWGPILLVWTVLSLYWLRQERLRLSGAVAALTLLKPNVGIALLAGIAAYALCANVPRRWWMGLALGLLIFWVGTQRWRRVGRSPGWSRYAPMMLKIRIGSMQYRLWERWRAYHDDLHSRRLASAQRKAPACRSCHRRHAVAADA